MNNKRLQSKDASDLAGAAYRDTSAMIKNAKRYDKNNLSKYKRAAKKIRQMTNDDYDDWLDKQLDYN